MFQKNDHCWFIDGDEVKVARVRKVTDTKISVLEPGSFETIQLNPDQVFSSKEDAVKSLKRKE